jgi:hypothetical protein
VTSVGKFVLAQAIRLNNPDLIRLVAREAGGLFESGWDMDPLGRQWHPVAWARAASSAWICELLLSMGAEDREIEVPQYNRGFNEEYPCRPPESAINSFGQGPYIPDYHGDIRVSRRTWEWVGKH